MTDVPAPEPISTVAGPTGLPGITGAMADQLSDGLDRVEALIRRRIDHDDPFVREASGHLFAAGGKRFRPMLTLAVALVGDGISDDVVAAAAAVELTHLASLYHDDVMDAATLRRGAPSVNAKYDNSTAILVGDLLFGVASELVADLGPDAVRIQAQTFVRLCAGQIRDDRPNPGGADAVDYYLGVLADKTGVLIATAARYGAMFSGADAARVELFREFGERIGIVFQLVDDLIDISSDEVELGKSPGTDLREGKATLPVLFALASSDPADAELQGLLRSDLSAGGPRLDRALELLRDHPAMDQARDRTREIASAARGSLAALPDGDVKTALELLATLIVDRVA